MAVIELFYYNIFYCRHLLPTVGAGSNLTGCIVVGDMDLENLVGYCDLPSKNA